MRSKFRGSYLAEAVRRRNVLAAALRDVAPVVRKILNGARITGDKVGKREREKISALLRPHIDANPWMRLYLSTQYEYTVYLYADFNAPASENTCNYGELTLAVAERKDGIWTACNQDAPVDVALSDVEAKIAACEAAAEAVRAAESALCDARISAGCFIG